MVAYKKQSSPNPLPTKFNKPAYSSKQPLTPDVIKITIIAILCGLVSCRFLVMPGYFRAMAVVAGDSGTI
jgi:hypothetical protein